MTKKTVPPGKHVPDSGIYRDSKSGEQSTLVRGKTAPPTSGHGAIWRQVKDTNSNDPTSRR